MHIIIATVFCIIVLALVALFGGEDKHDPTTVAGGATEWCLQFLAGIFVFGALGIGLVILMCK